MNSDVCLRNPNIAHVKNKIVNLRVPYNFSVPIITGKFNISPIQCFNRCLFIMGAP